MVIGGVNGGSIDQLSEHDFSLLFVINYERGQSIDPRIPAAIGLSLGQGHT